MKFFIAVFGLILAVSDPAKLLAANSLFSREEHKGLNEKVEVLNEILGHYANDALERPKDISICLEEMMAMRRSGKCRDKFSHYLSKEESHRSNEEMKGEYGGGGMELINRDGLVVVVAPLGGSPAMQAGLKSEDIIVRVDDKEVSTADEAARLIRGPKGSTVKITVARKASPDLLNFVIIRKAVVIHPVKYHEILKNQEKIAVVKINSFTGKTSSEFQEALTNVKKEKIRKVIIDLRNNPGGLLNAALEALALFMEKSDLALTVKERNKESHLDADFLKDNFNVEDLGKFHDLRVVILINKGSASASEIFSGTMKDWGYPVVGNVSFGKGVGQTVFTLSDGSQLWLTTFEFLVGNNRVQIRDKGVIPTFEIKNSGDKDKDEQMDKAIDILLNTH